MEILTHNGQTVYTQERLDVDVAELEASEALPVRIKRLQWMHNDGRTLRNVGFDKASVEAGVTTLEVNYYASGISGHVYIQGLDRILEFLIQTRTLLNLEEGQVIHAMSYEKDNTILGIGIDTDL